MAKTHQADYQTWESTGGHRDLHRCGYPLSTDGCQEAGGKLAQHWHSYGSYGFLDVFGHRFMRRFMRRFTFLLQSLYFTLFCHVLSYFLSSWECGDLARFRRVLNIDTLHTLIWDDTMIIDDPLMWSIVWSLHQALVCYGMGRLFLTRCPLLRQATIQTWCRALITMITITITSLFEAAKKDSRRSKHVKTRQNTSRHVKFVRECHVMSHQLRHATGSFWAGGGCCNRAQDVAAAAIHVAGA